MMNVDKKDDDIYFLVKAREGSRCRYSYNDKVLQLEGMLPEGSNYPEDYGIVSKTSEDSRKTLDGFLITNESIEPGSLVSVRPVACIRTKEEGVKNDKIIVVTEEDGEMDEVDGKGDLDKELFIELKAFINELCEAENKEVEIEDTFGSDEARRLIKHCKKIYKRGKD